MVGNYGRGKFVVWHCNDAFKAEKSVWREFAETVTYNIWTAVTVAAYATRR